MTELWTQDEITLAAEADAGELDTGSPWDGWHIIDVYEDLKAKYGKRIAVEHTRQIRENRWHYALNGRMM